MGNLPYTVSRRSSSLETLAVMPLLTSDEMAVICRKDRSSVSRSLNTLLLRGFVVGTRYSFGGFGAQRWRLTKDGVKALANKWRRPERDLLRGWPLSAEWEQSLLRWIQTISACYRIAAHAAEDADGCLSWRWERADVFDAFLGLPDGRTIGICRMGTALSTTTITSRLNSVQLLSDLGQVVAALVLVPWGIEKDRVLRRFAGTGVNVAVGLESDLLQGKTELWQMILRPASGDVSLAEFSASVLKCALPERRSEPVRAAPPRCNKTRGEGAAELLMSRISHSGANLFSLVSDWPLIEETLAQDVLRLGNRRFAEVKREVVDAGIVASLKIQTERRGRKVTARASRRMCLTNNGLRQVAWRDRVRLSELLKGWRIFEDARGNAKPRVSGYRLDGTKLRVLARELRHTDRVHEIMRSIQSECAGSDEYELEEMLPPHRWERWFYYNSRRYGIRPDATALVKCNGNDNVWLVEYEQRARTPRRMAEKMQRYVRYFSALDTAQDFEVAPVALIVLPDRGSAGRFAVPARRSSGRRRFGRNPRLRMLVSSIDDIETGNFMGLCWLDPWNMDAGAVSPVGRAEKHVRIGE